MKFKYTVCFVKHKNKILLLNREKAPIMGLWNGVGGKIENDETPEQAASREVFEETGIHIDCFESQGVVTWETPDGKVDGIHIFLGDIEREITHETPLKTREGILDWKEIHWILDSNNLGLPEKVPQYLPILLHQKGHHFFTYKNGKMIHETRL
jgi:8-oxo-dGTP diphosphatase